MNSLIGFLCFYWSDWIHIFYAKISKSKQHFITINGTNEKRMGKKCNKSKTKITTTAKTYSIASFDRERETFKCFEIGQMSEEE